MCWIRNNFKTNFADSYETASLAHIFQIKKKKTKLKSEFEVGHNDHSNSCCIKHDSECARCFGLGKIKCFVRHKGINMNFIFFSNQFFFVFFCFIFFGTFDQRIKRVFFPHSLILVVFETTIWSIHYRLYSTHNTHNNN